MARFAVHLRVRLIEFKGRILVVIEAVGGRQEFMGVIQRAEEVYDLLQKKLEVGAEYILTNAHRKRALFKVNL